MTNKKALALFAVILVCVAFSGCTAKYVHKSFKSEDIDRITVLPFMDGRQNPDPELHFEKMANFGKSAMIFPLKYNKKYRTVTSSDIGNVSSYSIQDLPSSESNSSAQISVDPESVDAGWVKQLGPSTEKWLLVPVLEDISVTNIGIMVLSSARVSAYLFNKSAGELWWQCSGSADFNAGILIYGIMKATTTEENFMEAGVISMSADKCAKTLPVRKSPYLLPDE